MDANYRKKLIDWMIRMLIVQIVISTFSSFISMFLIEPSGSFYMMFPLVAVQLISMLCVYGIHRLSGSEGLKLQLLYFFMVVYVIAQALVFIDYKGFFIILMSLTWYFSYLTLYREYRKMVLFFLVVMYLFFVFAYKNYHEVFEFSAVHLIAILNYLLVSAYIGFDLRRFNEKISEKHEAERLKLLEHLNETAFELSETKLENKRLEQLDEALEEKIKQYEAKNMELINEQNRFHLILDASSEVLWDLDLVTKIRHFSDTKIITYPEFYSFSANPEDWFEHVHPEDRNQMIDGHKQLLHGQTDYFSMEFRHLYENEYQWFLCRSLSLRDESGNTTRVAGSYSWIHPQKQKDMEIESYAFYDILTGFPNRSKLVKDLFEKIKSRDFGNISIYYMDLSGFREINNTYGHEVGDEIIKSIANRLKSEFFDVNVYRIGGPEFIFVDYESVYSVDAMTAMITHTFENPFTYAENAVHISFNTGISQYPNHGLHPEILLKHADTALYHAKLKGLRKTCIYNDHMTDEVTSRTVISNLLYNAIKTNEFVVYFQPIYNLDTGKLHGFEALARWFSPQIGQISPTRFIPIAEETGMIVELGNRIIEIACSKIKPYILKDPDLTLSVNFSAKQIIQEQFIQKLETTVESIGFPKSNLCIEITESVLIESFDLVIDKLNYLRNSGYLIALDDFGTGYSSLNYLSQLPISTLKIDKAFVDRIHDNSHEFYLLKSMITLARDLKLSLIVEGIETAVQRDLLRELGCILFQGYYFSRPLDEKGLSQLMIQQESHP